VRVNNREYTSDTPYPAENVAMEKAAESAYNICYNFSVNDGMMPGQRVGQAGVKQGLPVAIGAGRNKKASKAARNAAHSNHGGPSYNNEYVGPHAFGVDLSRESSPRTSDSEVDHLPLGSRRSSSSSSNDSAAGMPPICSCRRGFVVRYSRCSYCLSGY